MIWLNGRELEGRDGVTVADLLTELGVEPQARGVAVAVDGEVVPRADWTRRAVEPGARVEALTAMQGG
ncbi:MAG TPA: sulfur carrier protein ThiS [Solirubrobacteraceae bacterium]